MTKGLTKAETYLKAKAVSALKNEKQKTSKQLNQLKTPKTNRTFVDSQKISPIVAKYVKSHWVKTSHQHRKRLSCIIIIIIMSSCIYRPGMTNHLLLTSYIGKTTFCRIM